MIQLLNTFLVMDSIENEDQQKSNIKLTHKIKRKSISLFKILEYQLLMQFELSNKRKQPSKPTKLILVSKQI